MIFPERQKADIKMENDGFPMMEVKGESGVLPMMFSEKEKTAVKRPKPAKHKKNPLLGIIPDMKKVARSSEGAAPPLYWNVQPLQMPILPILPSSMANPLWANKSLGVTNLNPWSANTLANTDPKHNSVPEVDTARAKSHVENLISTDNLDDMQEEEKHDNLSSDIYGEDNAYNSGCPADLLSPTMDKEDKAVQWPEADTSGLAWKVLHDHYYKVRRTMEKSALRNSTENSFQEMDLEGELLSTLQYATRILLKNRKKRELKTARILNQTLEIITLITGEEWVIVKKDSIHKGIHELTGEVPVKCENVAVFFTLDEWNYVERHKQKYTETVEDNSPVLRTWKVQENWDSEEEYFSEEEEQEVEGSPKRKSSPEWKPGCDSSDLAEEEEEEEESDDPGKPRNSENGIQKESESSRAAPVLEELQYDCDACGEHLTSKGDLIRHKAVNHAVKRYPCPICGIQYDYKSQFIIHQRAHTGEKPFVCQECGAKFGHKSSYLVHERRHKEGKTFECEKCDRRFDKKCELVKHVKTHGKKKRHKCHKCCKRYISRSALMRHKWAHKDE
ncbi:uncharacterized protein [Pyxicephalus adspersus]|uniref:uncharacterized protein n=1 Tax=Pyxicephalus adspersus TaxID=30357 RepID=UPI003B5989F5